MAYQPRPDVLDSLRDKCVVMIVAPTAMGKSSVMNKVVSMHDEFARVSGIVTRKPRQNDEPGLYRYLNQDTAEKLIEQRALVQYVIHPTTGKLYGSQASDYPARYNLLDTLSTVVDEFHALPFKRHVTISLSAPLDAWERWLGERFPINNDEKHKRLIEAKQSIEWSLSQTTNHHWLVNRPNDLKETAKQLIDITRNPGLRMHKPPQEATELLQRINSLLSYGQ